MLISLRVRIKTHQLASPGQNLGGVVQRQLDSRVVFPSTICILIDREVVENAWLRSRPDIPVLRVGRSPPDGLDELKVRRVSQSLWSFEVLGIQSHSRESGHLW